MSYETLQWLNEKTAIGDTDIRGDAWHKLRGSTNHYPGAIPMEVVSGLIVPFEPTRQPLYIKLPDGTFKVVDNYIGMAAENAPEDIYAIHSNTYQVHPFGERLIQAVETLVDKDDLHVSSCGVLAKGAVAWVELALTDMMVVEGFQFRPHLLCHTSANGRYETSYGLKVQATVCDNTLDIADREVGQKISFRHTSGSDIRMLDVAKATGLIVSSGVAFDEEVRALTSWLVPPRIFSRWLDEMIPEKAKDGSILEGAALTRVERRREEWAGMWRSDPMIAPWTDTALGVLQLSNTIQHHHTPIRKDTIRLERNMLNTISGATGESDMHALGVLRGMSEAYGFKVPDQFSRIEIPQLLTVR